MVRIQCEFYDFSLQIRCHLALQTQSDMTFLPLLALHTELVPYHFCGSSVRGLIFSNVENHEICLLTPMFFVFWWTKLDMQTSNGVHVFVFWWNKLDIPHLRFTHMQTSNGVPFFLYSGGSNCVNGEKKTCNFFRPISNNGQKQ